MTRRSRHARIHAALLFGLSWASGLSAQFVVHAPLVGLASPSPGNTTSWFTETRIWSVGTATATVRMTDVVGSSAVQSRVFSIPAGSVLDLPYYEFTGGIDHQVDFTALIEFTSDQPIRVGTSVDTYAVAGEGGCPGSGIGTGDPTVFPYWGGCVPIVGPLLHGFGSYWMPGSVAGLSWLVAETESFRTTFYLTNPSEKLVTVTAIFRSVAEGASLPFTLTIPPHSMRLVPQASLAAQLQSLPRGPGAQGAATAAFSGDGPFYIFAAVIANDLYGHRSVVNRFAIVQPEAIP